MIAETEVAEKSIEVDCETPIGEVEQEGLGPRIYYYNIMNKITKLFN